MEKIKLAHLVKSEDLNHHGTLFAGRMSEWFVEACFIAAAKITQSPQSIVCLKIHGLRFNYPANKGDIINIETQLIKAGRTSFMVYGKTTKNNDENILAEGLITFVFVDDKGKATPHNLVLGSPESEEEVQLRKRAEELA